MRKLAINIFSKLYVLLGLNLLSIRKKRKDGDITVLCFHQVINDKNISYPPLTIIEFENILKYLVRHYTIISLLDINDELLKKRFNKPLAIISFDDGYKDFITNALPLVKKYNIKCNLNIVYNAVEKNELIWTQKIHCILEHLFNKDQIFNFEIDEIKYSISKKNIANVSNKMIINLFEKNKSEIEDFILKLESKVLTNVSFTELLNWNNITTITDYVSIGSHTISHAAFNNKSTLEHLNEEIIDSKIFIEKKIKKEVEVIALPNSLYNKNVLDVCCLANYKFILLVEGGYPNFIKYSENCYLVKRVLIHRNNIYENILDVEHVYYYLKKIIGKG